MLLRSTRKGVPDERTSPWDIQRLDKSHELAAFDCGKAPLDDWLKQRAGQYERRDLARTYVAVRAGQHDVCGYYAISSHQVRYAALPADQARGLPHIGVPVILIGRLAVDRAVQRQGLGQHLLVDALRRASHVSQHLGVRAVEVHAIDDEARGFYRKFGFVSLEDDRRHLYLPIQVVRKLGLPPL